VYLHVYSLSNMDKLIQRYDDAEKAAASASGA
jgi:hypothetical protein